MWQPQRVPGKTGKIEVQRKEGKLVEKGDEELHTRNPAIPYVSVEVISFWDCTFLSNITSETIHFLPAYVVTHLLPGKISLYSFWFWFSLNNSLNSTVAIPLHPQFLSILLLGRRYYEACLSGGCILSLTGYKVLHSCQSHFCFGKTANKVFALLLMNCLCSVLLSS